MPAFIASICPAMSCVINRNLCAGLLFFNNSNCLISEGDKCIALIS